MSNTSTVTPYDSAAQSIPAETTASPVERWLAEENEAVVERLRAERRHDRLELHSARSACQRPAPVLNRAALHMRNVEPLLQSAGAAGYRVERLARGSRRAFLLCGKLGERLAVTESANGQLELRTAGDRARIERLLHRYTVDRSVEHFRRLGMQVRTVTLANGEVQIEAAESMPERPDGAARIVTRARRDGSAKLDIAGLRGPRCGQIVQQYAEALGAAVREETVNDAYYQQVVPPATVRL